MKKQIKKYSIVLIIVLIIAVLFYYNYQGGGILFSLINSDEEKISTFVESFGALSEIIFVLLVIVEVILAPIPSVILYAVGGAIFGAFLGGLLALIGNIIGAIIAFKLAGFYRRKYLDNEYINKSEIFNKYARKYGGYAIFFLRLNPLTSSDVFSYLAGLTKMPLKHLILGTAFGLVPLAFFQSYIGETFLKSNPILNILFIAIFVGYIALFIYGLFRMKKKKNKQ